MKEQQFSLCLCTFSDIIINFAPELTIFKNYAKINRLKVVLAEKEKSGKWLADQLGKSTCTVSKWCSNTTQPDLQTMTRIAQLLNVDTRDLFIPLEQ